MRKNMLIEPVTGRLVRDPATGREIAAPTEVSADDPFWIRRLRDGDVRAVTVTKSSQKGSK